jgi:DnaK suppressor protein
MTKNEVNKFRGALENIQAELETGIRNREALTVEPSPDDLDRIQNASERDYAMSHLERNSTRLREINAAIRRIEGGAFGVCIGCEEDINPKRLAAVPFASLCIVCQEAADVERKAPWSELEPLLVVAA